jgi:hypothetical protein
VIDETPALGSDPGFVDSASVRERTLGRCVGAVGGCARHVCVRGFSLQVETAEREQR